ncbi:NADPH oxidase [Tanacetum coccineum]
MSSSSNHHKPPPSPPPPPPSPPPNVTTTLYHTQIGIFALTWSKTLFSRSLHLNLLPSTTTTTTNEEDETTMTTTKTPSFHIQIKPFIFWNKTGSKKIHISNQNSNNKQDYVTIYYDLSRAKFGPGPEPISGYYIAGIFSGQVTLLVGDSPKQALNKTKSNSPEKTQMTILRREHVAGICHKKYTTKATFRGKVHEICIDCTRVSTRDDSRLCFSVDGKRVLVVKHLQWKFRGNERVEIDGVHIQVSWDVHNWLNDYDLENNDDYDGGYALFMFRFEKSGFDYHEDDKYLARLNGSGIGPGSGFGSGFGFGFEMKKMKKGVLRRAKSSSSSSLSSASSGCGSVMDWESVEENELKGPTGFSLLVYAWKS